MLATAVRSLAIWVDIAGNPVIAVPMAVIEVCRASTLWKRLPQRVPPTVEVPNTAPNDEVTLVPVGALGVGSVYTRENGAPIVPVGNVAMATSAVAVEVKSVVSWVCSAVRPAPSVGR